MAGESDPVSGQTIYQRVIARLPAPLRDRLSRTSKLFLLSVVLPTLLSVVYYGLWASDVYLSESRFVVRSPEKSAASPLGMILQGAGFARAQDDTYTVHNYVVSRDALAALEKQVAVRRAYGSDDIDIFSRFAGIGFDDSFEALHQYFTGKVEVTFDASSAVSVLTVRAFSAEDAWAINEHLLAQSEALVNQLNDRGRQDLIQFAQSEVAAAEEKARRAALALSDFRDRKGVIDPEQQSAIQLQQVAALESELLATRARLDQLRKFAPENPQIPSLLQQEKSLRQAVAAERARVAGSSSSLANKAAEYQRLVLDREFADQQLATALSSMESARNDAQRKQLYLDRIVQPNKPDVALEPRRLRIIAFTFVLGLIVWGILGLFVASVREHQD